METEIAANAKPSVCPPIGDLFERLREEALKTVFANKALLDPSLRPVQVLGRTEQYERLVRYLVDLDHGYLPPLIQVFGPSGSGKTTVVRQVVAEAAAQFANLRVVYVNLKECRSVWAVANRALAGVTGSQEPPVSGLDGIFAKLWASTRDRPYLLIVLDEVDTAFEMGRYNPSDFIYRFVRHRDPADPPTVGLITITNRLVGLESLLDSRVKSSMGTHNVFFGPYSKSALLDILRSREGAFRPGTLHGEVLPECAKLASEEHGDARRALDLLRIAAELADQGGYPKVFMNHVWWAEHGADSERSARIIFALPDHEVVVLEALGELRSGRYNLDTSTVGLYAEYRRRCEFWGLAPRRVRRFIDFIDNLEMHGLVESFVHSSGRFGRSRYVWLKPDLFEIEYAAFNCLRARHRPDLIPKSGDTSGVE